jgi:hypothetical protein
MAGEVRTRIVIDADSRQAVTALGQVDKAAADADKSVGRLDGTDVDLSTSDATRALDKIETGADDALRAVREVDGASVDVAADTGRLDGATDEVTRLGRLAAEPLRINIDVDQAQVARIRETGDHVKTVGDRSAALQSGIGPLRGFTDEMGNTAGAAGTAANALIDAGEAAQIFGAQMGLSEKTLGRVSLGLGAIGLAVGVATYAWGQYREAQRKAAERSEELIDVQERLIAGKYREAAEKLQESYADLFADAIAEGLSFDDVISALTDDTNRLGLVTGEQGRILSGTFTDAEGNVRQLTGVTAALLTQLRDDFTTAGTKVDDTSAQVDGLEAALKKVGGAGTAAGEAGADGMGLIEDAAGDAQDAIARLQGQLSDERALLTFGQKSNDVIAKFREGVGLSLFDVADWKDEILNVASALGTVPEDVIVDLLAQSDDGLTEQEVIRTQEVINRYAAARPVKWPVFLDQAGIKAPVVPPMIAAPKPGTLSTFVQNVTINATPGMREVDAATARWLRVNGSG